MSRLPAASLAAVLACLVLTGCGANPAGPRAAATAYAAAWGSKDGAAVCRLLAPNTRAGVAKSGGKPCPQAVLDEKLPAPGATKETRVWGRGAQVVMAADTLFLSDFTNGWKVVAAGCRPQPGKPYDCQVSGG
jgi:hypothetical protein